MGMVPHRLTPVRTCEQCRIGGWLALNLRSMRAIFPAVLTVLMKREGGTRRT